METKQELLNLIKIKTAELILIDRETSKDKYAQISEEINELFKEYKAMEVDMIQDLTNQQKVNSDELNQAVSQLSPDEINEFLDFVGSPEVKALNDSLNKITKEVAEFIDNLDKAKGNN